LKSKASVFHCFSLPTCSLSEPFWSVYKQHDKDEVRKILAKYRIGSLVGGAAASAGRALEDPFKADPARHPALLQHSSKPCNAETPAEMLSAQVWDLGAGIYKPLRGRVSAQTYDGVRLLHRLSL